MPPSVRYTTPGNDDPYEDLAEDEKQAEIDISDDVTFGDPKLAGGLNERGGGVQVAGDTREFLVHSVDEDMIYLECPLCGSHSCIYGGNRFYTQACCYFHVDMGREPEERENISVQVERWTTEHLLAGESIDEVHVKLTAERSGRIPTRRDYVERIYAILHDERTADAYKHYLETGDDGADGCGQQERNYYMNEDYIITEEDAAHEKAADAAEHDEGLLTDAQIKTELDKRVVGSADPNWNVDCDDEIPEWHKASDAAEAAAGEGEHYTPCVDRCPKYGTFYTLTEAVCGACG